MIETIKNISPLYILIFLAILVLLFLIAAIFSIARGHSRNDREAKRLKELQKQERARSKQDKNIEYKEIIDKVTEPISNTLFKDIKDKEHYVLRRKLKITGMERYFNPISWYSFVFILAVIGIAIIFLLWSNSKYGALLIGAAFIFSPSWLLNNTYNNINADMLQHFPDVIRTTAGYLSSGLFLPRAFEETSITASKRWKPLLEEFAVRARIESPEAALDWLKEEVDVPQARQFFVTVRLSIENGINVENSFMEQANFIDDLLDDARQRILDQRELIGTCIQPALILLTLSAFSLPVIYQIIESGLFK